MNCELNMAGSSQNGETTGWTGVRKCDASTFMLGQVICGKSYMVREWGISKKKKKL